MFSLSDHVKSHFKMSDGACRDTFIDDIVNGTRDRVLMVHPTGSGKTHSALELCGRMLNSHRVSRAIFVTPSSVVHPHMRAMMRNLGVHAELSSFHHMSRSIDESTDIAREFKGVLIVVDEVHNVRDTALYHRLVRIAPHVKVLVLLSATPMRDSVIEILSVARILKPSELRHVTNERFRRYHMHNEYTVSRAGIKMLGRVMQGCISASSGTPYVRVGYAGEVVAPMTETRVVVHHLTREETVVYYKNLVDDLDSANKGLYHASIASTMGTAMFDAVCRAMKSGRESGEKTFVYSNIVNGGGIKAFVRFLDDKAVPRSDYAVITGSSKRGHVESRIQVYNGDDNVRGQRISTIIGSRVISESFSLKHVRHVHIITPFWNNTETAQAIGRATRFNSHTALPDEDRTVTVHRHVTLPSPDIEVPVEVKKNATATLRECGYSVSLYMYNLSEQKRLGVDTCIQQLMSPTGTNEKT